ncbi:acyl dehydratase [Mycobacterium antarcticum]|uniref:Zn-ribbon domain-containing OB-fold protein n=1 Tax=unclassified Mycolicibacterium TaxID=2636767 RepID=UPI00239BE4A2|nr:MULTISPECIES: OB-fold domain-containing protein [unclassified Mycolicibacterium]BDX31233.1 acyl dehydratase [Mycolicibacterium sp. TUM20985]GLP74587.1 acyl dehydratase [Mycolicibacterium sp. TUM20983]GLP80382.1 acyl dehydratase [Mycolicibacterium sp. TUM20984]
MSEPLPLPEPTPVSAPYWHALTEHRIVIQYSPSLGRYVFYPRTLAPGTLADDLQWREIDGAGTLFTYTVAERPTGPPWSGRAPQLLAVVQWDVGPRVSTELVDVEPDRIRIGMRVEPVFHDVPEAGLTMLRYRPA